jgi:hypothetical protein
MIFCNGSEIQAQDLFLAPPSSAPAEDHSIRLPEAGLVREELDNSLLTQALEYAKGNKTRAVALLAFRETPSVSRERQCSVIRDFFSKIPVRKNMQL